MRTFVIAEIGINHNGDIGIARDLVRVAKDAGCDAVKFQKRTIERIYTKSELSSFRESPWGATFREQKEGLELARGDYESIDDFCKELEIEWFASAWDSESQLFLRDFNLSYNKIASAMLVDLTHIEMVASEKKYTFISTGMSTLEDIDKAVEIFKRYSCEFELMHCVSTYPMSDKDANLSCIPMLRDRFQCRIGYSGHETGLAISFGAVALGVSSLERHITLDRSMYGSDQPASLEPIGLRSLIGGVRKIEKAMGDGKKVVISSEVPIAKKLRGHIKLESNN